MLNWMETRLLWNVNGNVPKLRRQFIEGYYGKPAADPIERIYIAIEKGAADSVTGKPSPNDTGNGIHGQDGYQILAPVLKKCRPDIDLALAAAQQEPEAFRYRITRDMKTLTGEDKSKF